eukprot:TRINITY_DN8703_c0_g1_i1.p1 TRINITY_DN8703_c0_g1~~TRINITY_DN8703_c0_g1_i1.p1  ORF type:complete len:878 (+),score=163.33 TRINITY_DN8703_c0_g1_i1:30-2636(+)
MMQSEQQHNTSMAYLSQEMESVTISEPRRINPILQPQYDQSHSSITPSQPQQHQHYQQQYQQQYQPQLQQQYQQQYQPQLQHQQQQQHPQYQQQHPRPILDSTVAAPVNHSHNQPIATSHDVSLHMASSINSSVNRHYSPTASDGPHHSPVSFSMYTIPKRKKGTERGASPSFESLRIPFGLLLSPLATLDLPPPRLLRTPIRCKYCTAVINRFREAKGDDGSWKCPFCAKINAPTLGLRDDPSPDSYPEFSLKVVEYEDPYDQPYSLEQLAGNFDALSPVNIFVIDITMNSKELEMVKEGLLKALDSTPQDSRVSIITFSNSVSLYDFSSTEVISADVLPGSRSPDEALLQNVFGGNVARYISPLSSVKDHIPKILSVIRGSQGNQSSKHQRCLGVALELALKLIRALNPSAKYHSGGRITTFLSASPNHGPGGVPDSTSHQDFAFHVEKATAFYKGLGIDASNMNTSIDIFCGGHEIFNVPILQNVVAPCSGSVLIFREWATQYQDTLLTSLKRSCGRDVSVEIITSDSLLLSQVVGSIATHATMEDTNIQESGVFKHTLKIGDAQPGQALSILFDYDEDIVSDYVYFQFNIKYTNFDNQRICRVVTHRLFTSDLVSDVLQSVDADVVSVLIAKIISLKATKVKDGEATSALDEILLDVCNQYTLNPRGRAFKVPDQLLPFQSRMYNFRRGALLGPILHNPDDLSNLRHFFLSRNLDDSVRIIDPILYIVSTDLTLDQVSATMLTLQSNFVLLMDQQTDVFIWYGRSVSLEDPRIAFAKQKAKSLSERRFPSPSVHVFKEGSSMSRWLVCRLAPAHKESLEEQLRLLPPLQRMAKTDYDLFLRKLPRTDDLSFTQYYLSLALSQYN